MKKLLLTGIAALFLAALVICYPFGPDYCSQDCEPWPEWNCMAGGQVVWKMWCKKYWTILLFDDDGEPDEVEPSEVHKGNGYYECTNVDNSKNCVWVEKQ